MTKKATAAVLLVSVLIWAEMALAPMLVMHAGHMRAGHEMAADMPVEHAAHHAPAEEMNHPCCPRVHKQTSDSTLEFAAGAPLCADPHSCCFRQGPQSVPAPAREPAGNDQFAKHLLPASPLTIPVNDGADREPSDCLLAPTPPSEVFGMTLRV
jgi:hypothetical protein